MPKGGSTTQTQTLDPQTAAYVQQLRRAALGYAGVPGYSENTPTNSNASLLGDVQRRLGAGGAPSVQPLAPNLPPEILQAQQQYGNYAQAGNLGLGALTGQAGAQAQFMNPYMSQLNPFFAQQRAGAVEGANQQATLAGAFGGDRSQIGAATAGNYADQNQAAFQYQGFQDAMQRAQLAAQLGFGAIGAQALLPQQYAQGQLGLLQQGLGPYGQTNTTTQQTDPWSQLLGLGLTTGGFLLGGPGGAAAGNQIGRQLGGGGYK